jgi:hypothetical protein
MEDSNAFDIAASWNPASTGDSHRPLQPFLPK